MEDEDIKKLFNEFITIYNSERHNRIWAEQSLQFRDFWKNKILNKNIRNIDDAEADIVIKLLDKNAKGNTSKDEAVAKVMIPQGVWRRMFNEIKENEKLKETLNKMFIETDNKKLSNLIDDLYKINKGRKNSLTGDKANAINALLFAFNPTRYLSIVSLNDRKTVINYFGLKGPNFENDTQGTKIVESNSTIIEGIRRLIGSEVSPRTIADFLYLKLKSYWKPEKEESTSPIAESTLVDSEEKDVRDPSLFYMEKQLEDFIIENWDKTDFGKKYELIVDDNDDVVSQQYDTREVGIIDILAKDKSNGQYVVIELKRNQTGDETVGQLCRYRTWVKKNLSEGKAVKGVIIVATYDKKLDYALEDISDVEIYKYKVDFRLEEFSEKS